MQPALVFSLSYCNAKIWVEPVLCYAVPVGLGKVSALPISLFASCSKKCVINPGRLCARLCLGNRREPHGIDEQGVVAKKPNASLEADGC